MVDTVIQRKNMVESQVRTSDVTDRRIIAAMSEVPREDFVPAAMRPLAYMDNEILLGGLEPGGKRLGLMAPRTFAKLIQLAKIEEGDVVLDVGCSSGYSSAILAKLAETVVALECESEVVETATKNLNKLSLDNVVVVTGDLSDGYAAEGPYDAIIVEGSVAEIPHTLQDQLKDGGRLVAIVSVDGISRVRAWYRFGELYDYRDAFEAAAPDLPGFEPSKTFAF